MRDRYEVNDYVNYIGKNFSNFGDTEVAKIDSIEKGVDFWKLELTIVRTLEKVHCLADLIRPIFTIPDHLKNLNFVNEDSVFRNGELIISGLYLYIPELSLHFNTGYCVGDLRKLNLEIFRKKYITDNHVDFTTLYNDYPSVSNINSLISIISTYYSFNITDFIGKMNS